jgi:hypothetical protein
MMPEVSLSFFCLVTVAFTCLNVVDDFQDFHGPMKNYPQNYGGERTVYHCRNTEHD